MKDLLKNLLSEKIQENIKEGNVKIVNIGLRKEEYEEDVL